MWEKFLTFMSGVGHVIMSFISPLAQSIAQNGGPVLVAAAEQEVLAAEQAGEAAIAAGNTMAGEEKFAQAQTNVVATLKAQGIPVVMNAVNGAIESAVAGMQAAATNATAGQGTQAAPQSQAPTPPTQ